MRLNEEGFIQIKKEEGFRNHPYLDSSGVPTIGYGFTYYSDGTNVQMTDPPISRTDADNLLKEIAEDFEDCVSRKVYQILNQNQYNALVSFAYNVGCDAFGTSTLLRKVNSNPLDPSIKDEFKKWIYSGGVKSKVLKKRRNRESYLYFS